MKKIIIVPLSCVIIILLFAYFNTKWFKKKVNNNGYYKDFIFVYTNTCSDGYGCILWPNVSIVKGADPASFEILRTAQSKTSYSNESNYSKDSKHIYYRPNFASPLTQINFADIESFTVISLDVAKDKNNVYTGDNIAVGFVADTYK